jgi:GNAT superfamily N-acetyltransferase
VFRLRRAGASPGDVDFVRTMLYEAAYWRPDGRRPALDDALRRAGLAVYVEDWGREGDMGVIAEDEAGRPVGAAWHRLFTAGRHGYGFLGPAIPEVTVAVVPHARGRGVGTALLEELAALARARGHQALSLSVEEDNPAVRLYRRLGYRPAGRVGNAVTMRLDLDRATRASRARAG